MLQDDFRAMTVEVAAASAQVQAAKGDIDRLRADLANVDKALVGALAGKDRKKIEALCVERIDLDDQIAVGELRRSQAESRRDSLEKAVAAAAMKTEREALKARREAFEQRFANDFHARAEPILSAILTATEAQAIVDKRAERMGERNRVQLTLIGKTFQERLLLPRLRAGPDGRRGTLWNEAHDLSRRPDIEPLGAVPLDRLRTLDAQAHAAGGADRIQLLDQMLAELKSISKQLALFYNDSAIAIINLLREEWQTRRDIFEFNRKAKAHDFETVLEDRARYWRGDHELGVDILLPNLDRAAPPLLSGRMDPRTEWDEKARGALS